MYKSFAVSLIVILVVSSKNAQAAVSTQRMDYSPCLNALNEYSEALKGRIFKLDNEGWTFAVREENGMRVVDNESEYQLSSKPRSCTTKKRGWTLDALKALYTKGTSQEKDAQNKASIQQACKSILDNADAPRSGGHMMSMPPGTGMMIPTQKAGEK